MKKCIFFGLSLLLAFNIQAQFSLDTKAYDVQKREAEAAQRRQDSLLQVQREDARIKANDIRFRLKWGNMLTYRQSIGMMESSYNLSYYGYFVSRKTWTFPLSLRLSSSRNYDDARLKSGYTDWSQHLTYLGLSGFRNLKDDFYLSLGGHLPLGWERYRLDNDPIDRKRRLHLMTGINAEERIFYMSPNKTGLILGVGMYQRLMTSKLYWYDIGITFEVGLKF